MTPQERAAALRFKACIFEANAARLRLEASAVLAAAAVVAFGDAFRVSVVEDIAHHPDLAELNVAMEGWYGA